MKEAGKMYVVCVDGKYLVQSESYLNEPFVPDIDKATRFSKINADILAIQYGGKVLKSKSART